MEGQQRQQQPQQAAPAPPPALLPLPPQPHPPAPAGSSPPRAQEPGEARQQAPPRPTTPQLPPQQQPEQELGRPRTASGTPHAQGTGADGAQGHAAAGSSGGAGGSAASFDADATLPPESEGMAKAHERQQQQQQAVQGAAQAQPTSHPEPDGQELQADTVTARPAGPIGSDAVVAEGPLQVSQSAVLRGVSGGGVCVWRGEAAHKQGTCMHTSHRIASRARATGSAAQGHACAGVHARGAAATACRGGKQRTSGPASCRR